MIGYYRNSICKLLDQIKLASQDPFSNTKIWYSTQLTIVKKIILLENKIRDNNAQIKKFQILRKNPLERLSKDESIKVKLNIKKLEKKIENIRFVISAYNSIGDAIAFTFINKLDIKPLNFKESAGFISDKDGLKTELATFREIYKKGHIGIINDITSVLKYCDITLIHPNGFVSIEVKSSNVKNSRVLRQSENATKIFNYLETDKIENLYGRPGITQRVELKSSEKNYSKSINQLIEESKETKNAFKEVEKGLFYFVSRKFESSFMKKNLMNLKKPMMISLNQYKFSDQGYYPFSLSITDSKDYFDFLNGEYVMMIIIDFDEFEKYFHKKGFEFSTTDDNEYGFEITPLKDGAYFQKIKLSNHYFFRVATEFVSLKWIINDSTNQNVELK